MTGQARKNLSKQMEQAAGRPAAGKPAAAPRAKPVRLSLDLAPALYRDLQEFCSATAVALERPRIAGAQVRRALLAELGEDSELAARIRARLTAN